MVGGSINQCPPTPIPKNNKLIVQPIVSLRKINGRNVIKSRNPAMILIFLLSFILLEKYVQSGVDIRAPTSIAPNSNVKTSSGSSSINVVT